MTQCYNKCNMIGKDITLKLLSSKFNKNFSMEDLIPVKGYPHLDDAKIKLWGTHSDMKIVSKIFSKTEPNQIDLAYNTSMPNFNFIKNVSMRYHLTIDYSFFCPESGYVGYSIIKNGMIIKDGYSEDPNSEEYEYIASKYAYIASKQSSEQKVLSIKDILKGR